MRVYQKTYLLLPPTSDYSIPAAILMNRLRITIGYSADDAGVGPADRIIYVVNPGEWAGGSTALEEFFGTYYPGTKLHFITVSTPGELLLRLLPTTDTFVVRMNDPRWAGYRFGEEGTPIHQAGCVLCTLTMMIRRQFKVDIHPTDVDRLLLNYRAPYAGDSLTNWAEAGRLFGFASSLRVNETVNAERVRSLLNNGWQVGVVRLHPYHMWLVTGVQGQTLHVVNPTSGQAERLPATSFGGIRALRITPAAQPPSGGAPSSREGKFLGPHITNITPDLLRLYLNSNNPSVVKSLDPTLAPLVREARPRTIFLWRAWKSDREQEEMLRDPSSAAMFVQSLVPVCQRYGIQWVEGLNETCHTGAPELLQRTARWEMEFVHQCRASGLRPVVLNAPVRNITPEEFQKYFAELVREVNRAGGAIGVHAYWWVNPETGESGLERDWDIDAGRFITWFRSVEELKRTPIIITECGAVGGNGHIFFPTVGWKTCYRGNAERYLTNLYTFAQRIAVHSNVIGATIFNAGNGTWNDFDITGILSQISRV